jgi:hypothetical protein
MSDLKWHFPILDGGEDDFFNDPLQEHFQGDVEYYIARETIQNALDARDDDNKPVLVDFEILELPGRELPGYPELSAFIDACMDYNNDDDKAQAFFQHAKQLLAGERIQLLRIGDYNTTGLLGGDTRQEGGNWYKLVKSVGKNEASGVAGGSFGIGKGAPFAASKLRYVLYSTKTKDGAALQGKARLTSHTLDEKEYRGVGTWGKRGKFAIRDQDDIPSRFVRGEIGTDVYVTGYYYDGPWMEALLTSVLQNFWAAIHFNDLVVRFLEKDKVVEIDSKNLLNYLEHPLYYYKAVTNPSKQLFEENLALAGKVKLYAVIGEHLPRAVQMMRLPKMVVKIISPRVLSEEYSGVFMLDKLNTHGNDLLKKLEPPKHDVWDPARGRGYNFDGYRILTEIEEWIRKCLRSMDEQDDSKTNEIPGLNSLLPEEDILSDNFSSYNSDEDLEGGDDNESGRESTVIVEKDTKPRRSKPITLVPADVGGEHPRQPDSEGGSGGGEGGGAGEDIGSTNRIDTSQLIVRAYPLGNPEKGKFRIILHSKANDKGDLRIIGAGDDKEYPVRIDHVRTTDGEIVRSEGSFIKDVNVVANKTLKLSVILTDKKHFTYSIGIERHVR